MDDVQIRAWTMSRSRSSLSGFMVLARQLSKDEAVCGARVKRQRYPAQPGGGEDETGDGRLEGWVAPSPGLWTAQAKSQTCSAAKCGRSLLSRVAQGGQVSAGPAGGSWKTRRERLREGDSEREIRRGRLGEGDSGDLGGRPRAKPVAT